MLPIIALTMGDPAGIGPEIAVKAAIDPDLARLARIVVYGCPEVIEEAGKRFANGMTPRMVLQENDSSTPDSLNPEPFLLLIRPTGELSIKDFQPGRLDPRCGKAAYDAVVAAAKDCLSGTVAAMVTAPVNKAAVNEAGIDFTGHTELVAEICGSGIPVMRQSAGRLRVAFVTTHIPLANVSRAVTKDGIIHTARLLRDSIVAEGVADPLMAMAALNPHAGESGHMGREEELVIEPALRDLRGMGFRIDGPFPPDTLFIQKTLDKYDGVVSMYHDQGHIPFKMLAFDRGVNTTLGLPIIRTSVDHGTAFDIAWKGAADTGSLFAAVRLACDLAKSRQTTCNRIK